MEEKSISKKKKPNFWRRDWHKKVKFGKHLTKNSRKWRAAKGRHNKVRLGKAGYSKRPRIGYGEHGDLKGKVNGYSYTKINTLRDLEGLKKGEAVILASFGKKKRTEVLEKCNKVGVVVLNKYFKEENLAPEMAKESTNKK